jgi:hypothetical protein
MRPLAELLMKQDADGFADVEVAVDSDTGEQRYVRSAWAIAACVRAARSNQLLDVIATDGSFATSTVDSDVVSVRVLTPCAGTLSLHLHLRCAASSFSRRAH